MEHRISFLTALDERGRLIPTGAYAPNRHDILTGSQLDGTAFPTGEDMTCNNWTSSSDGKPGSVIMTAQPGTPPMTAKVAARNSCRLRVAMAWSIVLPLSRE